MTHFDEIIRSIPVLKDAWDKYVKYVNTTSQNPITMYIKVEIPSNYSNWNNNKGEVKFSTDGIFINNMDTDEELVSLTFNSDTDSYSYIEPEHNSIYIWRGEPLILKLGKHWNADYYYYQDGMILDKKTDEEVPKDELESIVFQNSTVHDNIYPMQTLEEHMRVYDYANSELVKNNVGYLYAFNRFKGYNEICQTIMQAFR